MVENLEQVQKGVHLIICSAEILVGTGTVGRRRAEGLGKIPLSKCAACGQISAERR